MTNLEIYKNTLARRHVDRAPSFFTATKETMNELSDYMNMSIGNIINEVFACGSCALMVPYSGTVTEKYEDGSYKNMFGVRVKEQNYGKGSYLETIENPLSYAVSVDEVENYPWPDPGNFDYKEIVKILESNLYDPFTIGYHAIGWYSWDMRGMGQFLEDLLINEEIAEAIIEKVSDFCYENYKRTIEIGKNYIGKNFLCIQLADDWATQNGLMISPQLYKKYFKKHYIRIIDLAHNAGLMVEFHCCGSVLELIPELIDTGIDILNPIQTSANGMDPKVLKKEYGQHLIFSGGMDVQKILPFETGKRVKEEVKFLLDTLGNGGGYIFGPSHAIQVGTPPENIILMYEAFFEFYGIHNKYFDEGGFMWTKQY